MSRFELFPVAVAVAFASSMAVASPASVGSVAGKCILFTQDADSAPWTREETPDFTISGSLEKGVDDANGGCTTVCGEESKLSFANGIQLTAQICTCGSAEPYVSTSTKLPKPYGFRIGQTAPVPTELDKPFRMTTQMWEDKEKLTINGKELHGVLLRCNVKRVK